MSLNIETTQGLERRVTITVPAEAVEKATREEFKRAAKNVRVDGFRKGHVPAHIIEQRFGARLNSSRVAFSTASAGTVIVTRRSKP